MEINGAIVRRLRREHALAQRELAELAGVTRDTIAKIEAGERTHVFPATLRGIAQAFNVAPKDLMPENDERRSDNA